jgi:hypothetical protein
MGWGKYSSSSSSGSRSSSNTNFFNFGGYGRYNAPVVFPPPSLKDLSECRGFDPLTFICPHKVISNVFSNSVLTKKRCNCSANYLAYYTKHNDIPFVKATNSQRLSMLGNTSMGRLRVVGTSLGNTLGTIMGALGAGMLFSFSLYSLAYMISYVPIIEPLLDAEWIVNLASLVSIGIGMLIAIPIAILSVIEGPGYRRVDWTQIDQFIEEQKINDKIKLTETE